MLPVINAFKTAHQLTDVTVVADAGMISEANQVALQAAGLSFILGARIPHLPDVVREWRDKHPDEAVPDGLVLTQPWPATAARRPAASRIGSSTTSTGMTGPGARCAGSTSRSPRPSVPSTGMRRSSATGTSSSPAPTKSVNRDAGGQDPGAGRLEGIHHQPHRQPAGVRHRRLPPAVAHREELPDVQARPAGPPDLPPQPRVDRGAPERSCSPPGRQPLDRGPNRLEHQEIRAHRPPLPHRHRSEPATQTLTAAEPPPADLAKPSPRSATDSAH